MIEKIRDDFEFIKNSNVIYLDNSSTTLTPRQVIEDVNGYLSNFPLSYGRGSSKYTRIVNKKIEETRTLVKDFIHAEKLNEITFTNGATESSNLIAYAFGLKNLFDDDEILFCAQDHESTYLPWVNIVNLLSQFNVNVKISFIKIDDEGDYKENNLISKINDKTKIVVLTHIHNIFGLEMDIEKIVPLIRQKNPDCKIVLDSSQSVGRIKIDVQKLDVDFLFFSGHKLFSLSGVGVLYVKDPNYKLMRPFIVGGGFNSNIEENKVKGFNDFECGTQNASSIISLGSAIKYINKIGIEKQERYIFELTRYLFDRLTSIKQIIFNKGIAKCKCVLGFGILSFAIEGIKSKDVCQILDDYDIVARCGEFCNDLKDNDFIRVSLQIYNNKDDIDKLIKVLIHIIEQDRLKFLKE